MAADVIEWAKPVIGIIKADFTFVTKTSNTPKAVRTEAITINVSITNTPDSYLGKFSHRLEHLKSNSDNDPKAPPTKKAIRAFLI